MPNNPSQDTYNPSGTGSEFEQHNFSEINIGEIFRIHDNNNNTTEQFRKENDGQAIGIKNRVMYDFSQNQKVYIKI